MQMSMMKKERHVISLLLLFVLIVLSILRTDIIKMMQVYIVYMGSCVERETYQTTAVHFNMLQQVIGESSVRDVLIRNYKRSFSGFAAKLTDHEAKRLEGMNGVVSVFPSTTFHVQTTRSWDFIGFNETVERNPTVESNVTIGVIDSGIWPESESFSDKGFGPPPQKWKGVGDGGQNFTCNKKIIGARFYVGNSTRDEGGHGTHAASIAAGNRVKGASFFGLGEGTAKGGVPTARISAYRVCDKEGACSADGILAAFDDAIADGVDLITISIGAEAPIDIENDPIAIGSFHAMEKGILTVQAAGNSGSASTFLPTSSVSPWLLSVAASGIDRQFINKVVLGNGETLTGMTIDTFTLNGTKFPVVTGQNISNGVCGETGIRACNDGCLNPEAVKGNIVLCGDFRAFKGVKVAGGVGVIVLNSANDFVPLAVVVSLPAIALNSDNFTFVENYVKSENPVAEILTTETIANPDAPRVARFSSRGPNSVIPDVLKPDLSAPGVDILAAYSPLGSPSGFFGDNRQVKYSVLSGTSMACPHAAGAAVYVKSIHPDWSASAIKSALMTTTSFIEPNSQLDPSQGISFSPGNINPVKAINPGLVYETSKEDYINVLCSIGYTSGIIRIISGDNSSCPGSSKNASARDMNYPSLAAQVPVNKTFKLEFHRTATNVGSANSTYKVQVSQNSKHSLNVTVVPEVLSFKSINEKKSFNVTVTGEGFEEFDYVATDLVWSDGSHMARAFSRTRIPVFTLVLLHNLARKLITETPFRPKPKTLPLDFNFCKSISGFRQYHDGRPRGSLWGGKKLIGKKVLFVILGLKRFKKDEEKLQKFIKSLVLRVLKMDMIAVLTELESQEETFLAVKVVS
ncbi:hypothetical protein SLA2020_119960 [Shorea laevis]